MTDTITGTDAIIDYAIPLLSLRARSHSEVCRQYAALFARNSDPTSQYLSRVWALLAIAAGGTAALPPRYAPLLRRMPQLRIYVVFLHWLSEIYDFTGACDGSDAATAAFRCLRRGDSAAFFDAAPAGDDKWRAVIYSGAFSPKGYKRWRALASDYAASGSASADEQRVLRALCGDRDTLSSFSRTFFDRLWAEVYCVVADAMCGTLRTDIALPSPSSDFERLSLLLLDAKILREQFDDVYSDSGVPLILKMHMSIVFEQVQIEILESYADMLADNYLLEHIIFYASLVERERSLGVVSRICAGLPEPDKRVIDAAQRFGFEPIDVAGAIVSYTIGAKIDDFAGAITAEELTQRKVRALRWMKLASAADAAKLAKVRELISCLAKEEEFADAYQVFREYEGLFSSKHERNCWRILLETESRYRKWKDGDAEETDELIELLYEVIKYPYGWMKRTDEVDQSVGKHCIPMVVYQLFEVLESANQYEKALGIVCLLCDSRKVLHTYFDKSEMIKLVMKVKRAAIGKYRYNYK